MPSVEVPKRGQQMRRPDQSPRDRPFQLAAALILGIGLGAPAAAYYPPDGTKPAGPGAYQNPGDGICVIVDPTPEEIEVARSGDLSKLWNSGRARLLMGMV